MKKAVKTLQELFRGIEAESIPRKGIPIRSITADSRQVEESSLFVAIRGIASDGHRFIEEAVKRGAAAVVVQDPVPGVGIPVIRHRDTRQVLAWLVRRFYDNPDGELIMLGITGTNGKTTIAFLLESIMNACGLSCGLIGTILVRWPGHSMTALHTTPDSAELFQLLRTMADDGVQAVSMEVSSHALELKRVEGINYKMAIFTNLTQDHLDFHHNMDSYARAKSRLFSQLAPEGAAVLYADDPYTRVMSEGCTGRLVKFGEFAADLDYRIERGEITPEGTHFHLVKSSRKIPVFTPLLGNFNVLNVSAAVILALEMGLDYSKIQEAVSRMDRVPGRMEGFKSKRGFRVVVDYAHTPDALLNALKTARLFTHNRLIAVFGCGGDRDRGKRPLMGKIAAEISDRVIVTSDNPRTENPQKIIADILEGIPASSEMQVIEDRESAIRKAIMEASAGDTVLIAGKGHEDYQILGHTKIHFDDREMVEKYIKD
jgi:UDP-N-acetylmuramoyl-L-alanyl-D-glutamate--2,6-diaminopimelate ligase